MAIRRQNLWLTLLMLLSPTVVMMASGDSLSVACPLVRVQADTLPGLHIPRAGHQLFCVNGEYVVAGGHTHGFVPTPTVEYFRDGQWHLLQMVYNHDAGFSVKLGSGKVLLGGGTSEPIGIGQTYLAELYDPVTHTFDGFGSMEQKRTMASGLELDGGQVVIAGNWYHDDGIEVFDGQKRFTYVKDAAVGRVVPLIFQTAKDDAVVIGTRGCWGDTINASSADRLKGDSLKIPFLDTWKPVNVTTHRSAESFIGDASKGVYAYLLPVADSTGQVAIAKVENGSFSLLPTTCPVPMTTQCGAIEYYGAIIVDKERQRAYLMGSNADFRDHPKDGFRHYVLCIDYGETFQGRPAPLTLCYLDPLDVTPDYSLALTPDGNLLMVGGLDADLSNFSPSGHAYLLRVAAPMAVPAQSGNGWVWWLIAAAIITILLIYFLRSSRCECQTETIPSSEEPKPLQEEPEPSPEELEPADRDQLIQRIREVIESQQLFRQPGLKVNEVAEAVGISSRTISRCINAEGIKFADLINAYRIDYAKRLLRNQTDKKVSAIYLEAGFANESTFFRTFKELTGMTPAEWKDKID